MAGAHGSEAGAAAWLQGAPGRPQLPLGPWRKRRCCGSLIHVCHVAIVVQDLRREHARQTRGAGSVRAAPGQAARERRVPQAAGAPAGPARCAGRARSPAHNGACPQQQAQRGLGAHLLQLRLDALHAPRQPPHGLPRKVASA